jgi:hypothetical protein
MRRRQKDSLIGLVVDCRVEAMEAGLDINLSGKGTL